jgi:hypothetical protein
MCDVIVFSSLLNINDQLWGGVSENLVCVLYHPLHIYIYIHIHILVSRGREEALYTENQHFEVRKQDILTRSRYLCVHALIALPHTHICRQLSVLFPYMLSLSKKASLFFNFNNVFFFFFKEP